NGFLAFPLASLLSTVIEPEHVFLGLVNAEVVKTSCVIGTSTWTPVFALSDPLLDPPPEVLVTVTLALYEPFGVVAASVTGMVALRPDPLVRETPLTVVAGEVATLADPVVVPVEVE